MKRYRILNMDFDTRASVLSQEIDDTWEESVKQLWRENRQRLQQELQAEFGPHNFSDKLQNFLDLGAAPFSVLAFHNQFLRQARNSFIVGSYYPALTGACALGERILNHLIRELRDSYSGTPQYKAVYRKDSFDDWSKAIDVLEAWGVFLPGVAQLYRDLQQKRNDAIHFRPETDTNARELALAALQLLSQIIDIQFGAFGDRPWFIENAPGVTFIKREYQDVPFVEKVLLPNAVLVGPRHELEWTGSGFQPIDEDTDDDDDQTGTDEDFVREWKAIHPDPPPST